MTHKIRMAEAAESAQAKKRKREEPEGDREAARRRLFTAFRLWTVCPDKRCVRAKACRGDVDVCLHARWFVLVSAETRAMLGKALQLMHDGLSVHEAVAAVQADMAQREESAAAFDALHAEKQAAPAPATAAPIRRSAPVGRSPRLTAL